MSLYSQDALRALLVERDGPSCALADIDHWRDIAPGGVLDADHLVRQQDIRSKYRYGAVMEANGRYRQVRRGEDRDISQGEILMDLRNAILVCRTRHDVRSNVADSRWRKLPESVLPTAFADFVWEFRLEQFVSRWIEIDAGSDLSRIVVDGRWAA